MNINSMKYHGGKLINKGAIDLDVQYNDKRTTTTFCIVNYCYSSACELGLQLLHNLNVVTFNCLITTKARLE